MTTEELLIHELAERAGVSVRTIRYYIDEGLLPQPKYEGRYSYYKLTYLDRLELIRRLKDSYLPLREIREIMNSLTDAEVRNRLNKLPLPSPKIKDLPQVLQAMPKPGVKALEYIDRVMDDQSKYRAKGTKENRLQSFEHEPASLMQARIHQPEPSPAPPDGETWQHIQLAPGVELHIRRPLPAQIERRVHMLMAYIRKIFM